MTALRIGFLLPNYSSNSQSQMPVAMRLLADAGVEVEVVHPVDRVVDVSQVTVAHDLYVLKKKNQHALSLAGALHARGAVIVNPYPATVTLNDKVITFRILQAAGVPTPATYVAPHPERFAPLLDDGPLVVKPYQGCSGHGVRIVRTPAELREVPPPDNKDPAFAQRFHQGDGRDRKLYCIGGKVFGVKKVFPARTQEEKYGEPFTPSPELTDIALRCGRALGIDLFGVDIVESEGRPYVVDMASMPGFKGVPDAPRLLARYFYRAAQQVAHGFPVVRATQSDALSNRLTARMR